MKLIINRRQQDVKGRMGGPKGAVFTVNCRLELTAEETDLVRRFRLGDYKVTITAMHGGRPVPGVTLAELVEGKLQSLPDVAALIDIEDTITDACDRLPNVFDVCRSFGGEEVITYPRSSS